MYPAPTFWASDGSRIRDTGNRKQETGNRKQFIGYSGIVSLGSDLFADKTLML